MILYRNPEQIRVFSPTWFEYQEPALLNLVNHKDKFLAEFWRNSMGIPKDYDQAIITKIRDNCFHLYDGGEQRVGVFYSKNPLAKAFEKNLIVLWKCAHTYDAIAKLLKIKSNLGFDTLVANPGTNNDAISCDGYIYGMDANWTTARTTGTTVANTGYVYFYDYYSGSYLVLRSPMGFVTSTLTANAIISGVTLGLYYGGASIMDASYYGEVVGYSGGYGNFVISDFGNFGATTFASKQLSTIGSNWTTLTLNSSGITNINKVGVTGLGLRTRNDINNTPPTTVNYIYFNSADTGYGPTLTITYSVSGTGRKQSVFSR